RRALPRFVGTGLPLHRGIRGPDRRELRANAHAYARRRRERNVNLPAVGPDRGARGRSVGAARTAVPRTPRRNLSARTVDQEKAARPTRRAGRSTGIPE